MQGAVHTRHAHLQVLWRHRHNVASDSARKKVNKKKASKQVKNKVK